MNLYIKNNKYEVYIIEMDKTLLPTDTLKIIFSYNNKLLLLCKNVEHLYIKIISNKKILNIDFKKYVNIQYLELGYNRYEINRY